MNCKSCGSDNSPDACFCEDCGAQLGGDAAVAVAVREGPLGPSEVVADSHRIEEVLEAGRINRYRAVALKDPEQALLLLEAPKRGEGSLLAAQSRVLERVEHRGLFLPLERLSTADHEYACDPIPGSIRLEDRVKTDGPLSPEEVTALGEALGRAVAALHGEGVLSRSIQPSRIWLGDERGAVLDTWDRAIPEGSPVEDECSVTPGFSAPEFYVGGTQDQRSDVFSLGAVLYFALTGSMPNVEARESFFNFPRPQVEGAGPLVDLIMKAVSKSPEARYPSVAAMREALAKVASGEPLPADAPTPAPRPTPAPSAAAPVAPRNNNLPAPPREGPAVALKTDVGKVRSINQDACLELRFRSFEKSQPRNAHLVVVVDGMGGEAEGDKAASLALRAIAQEVVGTVLSLQDGRETSPLVPTDRVEKCRYVLQRALETANRVIFDYASQESARRGMGCTITSALIDGDLAVFAHVGDTRGYILRSGGTLDRITTDHSLVGRLVALGSMTEEEARTSNQRSIIYRAMGTNPDVEVDLYERPLQPGDRVLICCDGIWEYYEAGELEEMIRAAATPQELCDRLVDTCLSRGADDNTTCAVVFV